MTDSGLPFLQLSHEEMRTLQVFVQVVKINGLGKRKVGDISETMDMLGISPTLLTLPVRGFLAVVFYFGPSKDVR